MIELKDLKKKREVEKEEKYWVRREKEQKKTRERAY